MDSDKKNIIYKALAVTFSIMFFSVFFSQILYERKMTKFDMEMTYLRDTLKEGQLILSLRQVLNTKKSSRDTVESLTDGLADRLYKTGIYIERLSNNEDGNDFFSRVSREWIYLNLELWQKLVVHNKNSRKKKSYLIYIYPSDCSSCVPYKNLFNKLHKEYGEKLWLFILPDDSESGVLHILKQYYNIEDVPAIIVNGRVVQNTEPLEKIEKILEKSIKKPKKKTGKNTRKAKTKK